MTTVTNAFDFVVRGHNAVMPDAKIHSTQCLNSPDLAKSLQRRLSPLAKLVFNVAQSVAADDKNIPLIFCTAHGEINKSFSMLKEMQLGAELSPTAFSLSVHSAIAGLFSIAFVNHQEIIVIAPGQDGIAVAFVEALGVLQEGQHNEVLVVFYDEVLPAFFSAYATDEKATASCALALRLALTGSGIPLTMSRVSENFAGVGHVSQIVLFWEFLMSEAQSLVLNNSREGWQWCKK